MLTFESFRPVRTPHCGRRLTMALMLLNYELQKRSETFGVRFT